MLYETQAQRARGRVRVGASKAEGGGNGSNTSSKDRKTNWIMHQYHVGAQHEEKEGQWVVSKVFYQVLWGGVVWA